MSIMYLKEWKKSIVLFEKVSKGDKSIPIGTGFCYGFEKWVFLITCKHVAESENLWVRYNAKPGLPFTMLRTPITQFEKFGLRWCFHPNPTIDLAAMVSYAAEECDVLEIPNILHEDFADMEEGDNVFFLGFPLGLTQTKKVTPVIRSGIVALKKDDLTFLIEANAFPGSSGSPVFGNHQLLIGRR